jgi:hypothetical protein
VLERRELLSITFDVRYEFDTNNFFNTQAKRDLLQQAANSLGARLNDNLTDITPGGTNTWSATFSNPSNGLAQSVPNLVVPANTIILFVGGSRSREPRRGLAGRGGSTRRGRWLGSTPSRPADKRVR